MKFIGCLLSQTCSVHTVSLGAPGNLPSQPFSSAQSTTLSTHTTHGHAHHPWFFYLLDKKSQMLFFLRSAACSKSQFPHKQTPKHVHAHTHTNWLRQIQLTHHVWALPTASSCLCCDSWGRAMQWATLTNVQLQPHRVRKKRERAKERDEWQFLLRQGHLHCSNP